MTDRPIIFSAPMVRALLDGRKTQTRRLLKKPSWAQSEGWPEKVRDEQDLDRTLSWFASKTGCLAPLPIPQPKDRLYVREAWRVGAWNQCDGGIAVDYLADNHARKEWLYSPSWTDQVHTRLIEQSRADAEKAGAYRPGGGWEYSWSPGNSPCRSRPSIHMPRWASRLTLIVTDARVQRLQEISSKDVLAEGVDPDHRTLRSIPYSASEKQRRGMYHDAHVSPFRDLWNSLHGPDAWAANPWVVALTFTVQHGNIDQIGGAA